MNDSHVTDQQLDRLVDGELSDESYRGLLVSLDDEPGGWRRCALAFIEAQALQQDLGMLSAPSQPTQDAVGRVSDSAQRKNRLWPLALAMAACFLIAFTIGSLSRSFLSNPAAPFAGSQELASDSSDGETAREPDDARDAPTRESGIADGSVMPDRTVTPQIAAPRRRPLGNMTILVGGDGNEARQIELPYYQVNDQEMAELAAEQPLLPPEFTRAVWRMGHDLRQRRQFLPIKLDDGRRVLVPIDQVEIVPVGGQGYQ